MKKRVLWILLDLVFLILFNVLFFLTGFNKAEPKVWICYGFIHFSYLMLIVTPALVRKNRECAVLGFPLYYISSVYALATLAVGSALILLPIKGWKVSVIVMLVLTCVYLVMLLSVLIANEDTVDAVESRQVEVAFIRTMAALADEALSCTADGEVQKLVKDLRDAFRASPTKSYPGLKSLEADIQAHMEELPRVMETEGLNIQRGEIEYIKKQLESRNRKAQLLN